MVELGLFLVSHLISKYQKLKGVNDNSNTIVKEQEEREERRK